MNTLQSLKLTPKMPKLGARQSTIVTAIDIGSFKIACVIAKLKPLNGVSPLPGHTHSIEVLGFGYAPSQGIKNGYVVDFEAAESALRQAIDQAEQQAGLLVESAIINASCGRPFSRLMKVNTAVNGQSITDKHIHALIQAGLTHEVDNSHAIVHALPLNYQVDHQSSVRNPLGMRAQSFSTSLHLVKAEKDPVNNLLSLLHRCHIDVLALVSTPYASALSTLVEDEAEVGIACIDFGAGTTSLGVFLEGQMLHVDALGMGGNNISLDLARELGVSLGVAERMKVLHGSALALSSDATVMVPIPETLVGDEIIAEIPRLKINQIIQRRCEEILILLRNRLSRAGFSGQVGRRVIITGGGAELADLANEAQRILKRPVRVARPLGVAGLPEMARLPSFATVVGLLAYPQITHHESHQPLSYQSFSPAHQDGYLNRVVGWLKESF